MTCYPIGEGAYLATKLDEGQDIHVYICNDQSVLYFHGWDDLKDLHTVVSRLLATKPQ